MRENLMRVQIIIIIEQIELNGMCANIQQHEYASWGLICKNLAVRKYLHLQYTSLCRFRDLYPSRCQFDLLRPLHHAHFL